MFSWINCDIIMSGSSNNIICDQSNTSVDISYDIPTRTLNISQWWVSLSGVSIPYVKLYSSYDSCEEYPQALYLVDNTLYWCSIADWYYPIWISWGVLWWGWLVVDYDRLRDTNIESISIWVMFPMLILFLAYCLKWTFKKLFSIFRKND